MQAPTRDLSALRAEIDRLDDAILDLLSQRLAIVSGVAAAKGDRDRGSLALRPAREAEILRRLVTRAAGRFPALPLARIWRELLAVTTQAQTPFKVAIACEPGAALWDLARDHLGTSTPLERVPQPADALRRLRDGKASMAFLPLPDAGEAMPWWRSLAAGGSDQLSSARVIGRLPFVRSSGSQPECFVVAALEIDQGEDDRTLLVMEMASGVSRSRLAEVLAAQNLDPVLLVSLRDPASEAAFHLVEIAGAHQARMAALEGRLAPLRADLLRMAAIGGYPRPLTLD